MGATTIRSAKATVTTSRALATVGISSAETDGSIPPEVPLIIIIGESNAGGQGVNSLLTTTEKATRTTKILNNTSLLFENLLIGTNNLIGHTGLTDNATHGPENGFANQHDEGRWGGNGLYLVKCGQGGSKVAEWSVGNPTNYWSTAVTRIEAAISEMALAGKTAVPYILLTIGINDMLVSTGASAYETGMQTIINNLYNLVGICPLVLTKFMEPYQTYDTNIDNLVAANSGNVFSITASPSQDLYKNTKEHWDHTALRNIAELAADKLIGSGTANLSFSIAGGTYGATQSLTLSSSTPGADIRYTLDGSQANSQSTLYTGAISVANNKRVSAVAIANGYKNGYGDEDYVIGSAYNEITWTTLTSASQSGNNLVFAGTAPGGATSNASLNAGTGFTVYYDLTCPNYNTAHVVYLDETAGTDYSWSGSNSMFAGFYFYNSSVLNISTAAGGGPVYSSSALPTPCRIRMKSVGNDLVFSYSIDGDTTWTTLHTLSGALSGMSTIYLKCMLVVNVASYNESLMHIQYSSP